LPGRAQLFIEDRGSRQPPAQVSSTCASSACFSVRGRGLPVGAELFNLFNGQSASEVKTSVNNQFSGDPASLAGAVRLCRSR
jgi:hypothetical protein